jgi:ribosome-associated protein
VNKVNTKAMLRVAVADLARVVGDAPVTRLRRIAAGRINSDDELLITSEEHRSQHRNRAECIERLRELLVRAMVRPKRRRATKPSRAAKERRLESKKRQGEVKRRRSEREW